LVRLFASGTFQTVGREVRAEWLIPRPVVDSLLQ
jgi:hypothetical protein